MKNNFEKMMVVDSSEKTAEVSGKEKNNRILSKLKKIGLASLISLASFGAHAQDKEVKKQEVSFSKENKKDSTYPKDFYDPASKNYNPLKVYEDLALEFHPENIDSSATGLAGGELSPLAKEMDKIKAPQALDFNVEASEYEDKNTFMKDFVQKRGEYLSQPGVKEQFEMHDAYFKGKAFLYDSLLKKYRNDFNKFKEDKPSHALTADFFDITAGLVYNRKTEDFDYNSEEDFKNTMERWQENAEDGMPEGDKIWDYEWQKSHLAEEAEARWNIAKGVDTAKSQAGLN